MSEMDKPIFIKAIATSGFDVCGFEKPLKASLRFGFGYWNICPTSPGIFRISDPPPNINSALDIAKEYLQIIAPSVFYLITLEIIE